MKNLTWSLFAMTGNPESYLLYKEVEQNGVEVAVQEEEKNLTSEDQEFLLY